ncbi:MAG: MarR family transcriptional regulator [Chloroflexota bacterium]|nr:MarR family transcriptional regulator [Chloroflexota bacterium]
MSTPENPRADLLAAVIRDINRANAQSAAFSHALAAQLGIGPTDLECLALLQELGATSAGQLADMLSLTTGAITGVVDRLETAGFVTRESDPSDRRRVIVRPVQERLADLDRAYEPLLQAATRSLESYSDADLQLLVDFQRRASDLLQQQAARLRMDTRPGAAGSDFSAPLSDVTAGYLEFGNGASELRIYANDSPVALYRAAFEGPEPGVRVQGGSVVFRHKRMSLLDWGKHAGSVALNRTIPWRIVLRGGASKVVVDARALQLQELSIQGGASKVDILLSPARGSVPVCLEGGLSRVQIQRPTGVPAQLQVRGGANRLEFDGQRFGAIGGDVRLASPGWELASDRYDIEARGGASRLEVGAQPPERLARWPGLPGID